MSNTLSRLALAATTAATLAFAPAFADDTKATTKPAAGEKPATQVTGEETAKDIVDTAVAAGNFTTLAKLLTQAGLVDALKDPKAQFTVFAPTDEAFAKVPKETLDAIAADPAKLKAVLTYHVVPGRVASGEIVSRGGMEAKTLQGSKAKVTVKEGKVMVDAATVVAADIQASNGIIHVIDSVILPPADKKAAGGSESKPATKKSGY